MAAKQIYRLSSGALLWVLNVQYFVMQAVVAAAWAHGNGYSWANNTISDLANTQCGLYGVHFVCSPLHTAMNISFVVLGATIIGGASLLGKTLAGNSGSRLGFGCMASAGVGAVLVGLFPENSVSALHIAGAALSFAFGNLGMILLGLNLTWLPKTLRTYTTLSGLIGLAALLFFMTKIYAGLGIGGMERVVSYPQTIWMIIFGAYFLVSRRARAFTDISP